MDDNKWSKPYEEILKCNVHSSWISSSNICGGAWIVGDFTGNVIFHARDAFMLATSRVAAKLRGIIWTLKNLEDLRVTETYLVG